MGLEWALAMSSWATAFSIGEFVRDGEVFKGSCDWPRWGNGDNP